MSNSAVPALNLRVLSFGDAHSPTPPQTPADPSGTFAGEVVEARRQDDFLGCDVKAITDVTQLQAKLKDAQSLFLELENRYRKSLESKQRQLTSLTAAIAMHVAAGGVETTSRPSRLNRGVQVGFPSVPSSLSSTPRSTRGDPSRHYKVAMVSRSSITPRTATFSGMSNFPSHGPMLPSSSRAYVSSNTAARPLTARVGITTTAGPSSPRTVARDPPLPTNANGSSGPPNYRPYQPATRRSGVTSSTSRAITPRY